MRRLVFVLILALACARSRAPIRLGVKNDVAQLTTSVASQLQRAGCVVEMHDGDSAFLDRALRAGEIDAYIESHQVALKLIGNAKLPGPAAEAKVRSVYLKEDLMWAPMLGQGDLAVVFRRKIDERCRAASRALMDVNASIGASSSPAR